MSGWTKEDYVEGTGGTSDPLTPAEVKLLADNLRAADLLPAEGPIEVGSHEREIDASEERVPRLRSDKLQS